MGNFSWAATNSADQETLILAKGEQIELNFQKIAQFSVGNREVLSTKIMGRDKILFIKGKSLGYTDLLVWDTKIKKHYQVYVISKKSHLEHAKLIEVFQPPHWQISFEGNSIAVKGEIINMNQWQVLNDLSQSKKNVIFQDISLEKTLKRELLKKIYSMLRKTGIENFRCDIEEIPYIDCHSENILLETQIKYLKKKATYMRWNRLKQFATPRNVRAKIKLLSFDLEEGEDWQKGLGFLKGQLHQIFEGSFWNMIKFNAVHFKKYWNKAQVLAEPEFTLSPDSAANFSVGSEIPYWNRNQDLSTQQNLEWKFAGLKVEIKISSSFDPNQLKVEYQTSLTSPMGEQIQGHQQKAELIINKNENTILFDINYQSLSNSEQGIPFWKKIPILYKLFADDFGHQSQKKITAVINLNDEKDD